MTADVVMAPVEQGCEDVIRPKAGSTSSSPALPPPPSEADIGKRCDPFSVLVDDLFDMVLGHLDVKDIIRAEAVSRAWRSSIRTNKHLWRTLGRQMGISLSEWEATREERTRLGMPAHPDTYYHDACMAHLDLKHAWAKRHVYETLLSTPAFKIRHVALDPEEDTIYALTESPPQGTDKLLVFNRYTGKLLLTIPWITRNATISVGAGYIVVSNASGPDYQEETSHGAQAEKVQALTVFRTAKAAQRSAEIAQRRGNTPTPFKRDRGLPLEYYGTVAALAECRAYRVKPDSQTGRTQAVLAGVAEGIVYFCYLDDELRVEEVPVVIDSLNFSVGARLGDAPTYLIDVNFDEEFIYVLTTFQCHVFYRESGEKLVAFPDPRRDAVSNVSVVYNVPFNFPFHLHREQSPDKPKNSYSPKDLPLCFTSQAQIKAWRGDTQVHEFNMTIGDGYDDGDDGSPPLDSDDLRSITLSDRDMILCRCEGSAFIVRDYRRVFQTLRTTGRSERLAKVAANTCVVKFRERLDVIQIWGSRLFCHSAEMVIFILDLDQLPSMPLQHKDALPNVHAQVFEISCLEGMQERSSLAVDARGAYLADWDKGYPDPNQDYEDLQRIHVENGGWPFAIRPRWGCIKVWTVRPESVLLTYPYPQRAAALAKNIPTRYDATPEYSDVRSEYSSNEMSDMDIDDDELFIPPNPFADDDISLELTGLFDGYPVLPSAAEALGELIISLDGDDDDEEEVEQEDEDEEEEPEEMGEEDEEMGEDDVVLD